MKNYTAEPHPDIEVAFTSERSIEDELDRESHSDVSTILVSYIIMFAYIAIALGQIRTCSRLLVRSLYISTNYSRTLLRSLSRDQRIRDSLSGKTW
jgi:hypothetical protein